MPATKINMSTNIEQDSDGIYYLAQSNAYGDFIGFGDLDLTQYPEYYWEMYLGFTSHNPGTANLYQSLGSFSNLSYDPSTSTTIQKIGLCYATNSSSSSTASNAVRFFKYKPITSVTYGTLDSYLKPINNKIYHYKTRCYENYNWSVEIITDTQTIYGSCTTTSKFGVYKYFRINNAHPTSSFTTSGTLHLYMLRIYGSGS